MIDPLEAPLRDVARQLRPLRPIVPCRIQASLGLSNGTQLVLIAAGGAQYVAVYLPTLAVEVGKAAFAQRGPGGQWVVVATNYQVG